MTRCVFVRELQEKEEDEKKKARAQIKERAKDAQTKKELEEEKYRREEETKEAKEAEKKKAKAQTEEKAKDAQAKNELEQVNKRGEEEAMEAEAKTKLEKQQKQGRIANNVKSRELNEAKKAREDAGGKRKWLRRHELSDKEVRVLCARARACKQYFLFMLFYPHMLERALSLGVRPFLLLRRNRSFSFV